VADCIIWNKAVNSLGYPVTWADNKIAYVHRVLMGAKPGDVVMHTCDNPRCVNPDHLKIGTHKENSADMVHKNRQAKGEKAGNSKLTEDMVLRIRHLEGGFSSRAVAAMFNISKTNVLDIWKRKIWRHI
jgi:hypothetical protein